ncbi:tRNA (guanosine(46)-N7)-methyltransferase TrmB [Thauera sinica]|uniref:tRNA (guanine-N(7)-)-methyltransferase n=1 Tax=Thauera sinica TaxID=2665146 RepID=A0ABW1AU48_9RHOO|nr:tRNA (guanosine(46)-N7)-methyltransferase TrmB [Thauera sp. K11]ATE61911.1 tRNA (guanosine(46)-N7)-methyltransferase TrmB [Thauera sp. K11]
MNGSRNEAAAPGAAPVPQPVAVVGIIGRDSPEHRFSSRSIRSFVLRQGRMSEAQQRHLDDVLPKVGIPYRMALLDLDAAFGRPAPKILEIGFGMGETTAKIAAAMPDRDFLGIEVHTPGVGALCKLIAENRLANLRIVQHDAVEVMRDMIADGALAGVHIFFPDPWRKKRHFKRRLIQPDFVALVARKLAPGGYLHCATDWEDYAHWMLEVISAQPALWNTATDFAPRPEYRPLTKFENRGLKLGHGVWDLVFRRRAD